MFGVLGVLDGVGAGLPDDEAVDRAPRTG